MDKYIVEGDASASFMENVLVCRDRKSGVRVAIKRLEQQPWSAKERKSIERSVWVNENAEIERRVARHLNQKGGHDNILRLLKDFHEHGHEHLVFEYCAAGTLFDLMSLSSSKHFSPARTLDYFYQVVNGVVYMHKRGYAHCDLSLETIYVTEKEVCKLGDFGLATEIGRLGCDSVGKYIYMAPELYKNSAYDPAMVDIWSLGIMLFIMLTGIAPFHQASHSDDHYELFLSLTMREFCQYLRVDHLISMQAMDLLERMLQPNPSRRYVIHQVVSHSYFVRDRPNRKAGLNFFQKVLSPLRIPMRRPSGECDSDSQRALSISRT